jgi:Lrp/AsnC family transcriptional regulator, leucine-responsive regulatory protein
MPTMIAAPPVTSAGPAGSPKMTAPATAPTRGSRLRKAPATLLDPAAVGFPLQLYVTATLSRHDPRSSRIFEDEIRALPQIITADNVAGETDYLLTVVARDVTDLQEVLASLSTRGGHRLVTYLRLAEVKPPSRLPLVPTTPAAPRRRRRQR